MDTTISPTPAWRSLLRPLTSARGYTALTHHLLGLPLGIAYFTWLVTGLATGLGLAITLIGIPLLTLVLASVRLLLAGERVISNSLLGTEIPSAPLAPRAEGWIGRLKAYWTDSATWRGIAYLLARFPPGTFTFTVAVATYGSGLFLIAAPVVAPFDRSSSASGSRTRCSRAWLWCRWRRPSWWPRAGSPRGWLRCRARWPAGARGSAPRRSDCRRATRPASR